MNAQENQTTASPAGAEDWVAFCRQPLEAVLQKPAPAYAGVVEEPAREHIRELMSTEYMQQMLTRYTEPEKLVEIADAFREWAESRPAGSSLLLEAEDDAVRKDFSLPQHAICVPVPNALGNVPNLSELERPAYLPDGDYIVCPGASAGEEDSDEWQRLRTSTADCLLTSTATTYATWWKSGRSTSASTTQTEGLRGKQRAPTLQKYYPAYERYK